MKDLKQGRTYLVFGKKIHVKILENDGRGHIRVYEIMEGMPGSWTPWCPEDMETSAEELASPVPSNSCPSCGIQLSTYFDAYYGRDPEEAAKCVKCRRRAA